MLSAVLSAFIKLIAGFVVIIVTGFLWQGNFFRSVGNIPCVNWLKRRSSRTLIARFSTISNPACTSRMPMRMHKAMMPSVDTTSPFPVCNCGNFIDLVDPFKRAVGNPCWLSISWLLYWVTLPLSVRCWTLHQSWFWSKQSAWRRKTPRCADHCHIVRSKHTVRSSAVIEYLCLESRLPCFASPSSSEWNWRYPLRRGVIEEPLCVTQDTTSWHGRLDGAKVTIFSTFGVSFSSVVRPPMFLRHNCSAVKVWVEYRGCMIEALGDRCVVGVERYFVGERQW